MLQQLLRELAQQRPEQELPQVEQLQQLQQHAAIPASSASDAELQEVVEGMMLGWSRGHDQQQCSADIRKERERAQTRAQVQS